MVNRAQVRKNTNNDPLFKLKPMAQMVKAALASGLFAGNLSAVQANPLHIGHTLTAEHLAGTNGNSVPHNALPVPLGDQNPDVVSSVPVPIGAHSSYTISVNPNGTYTMTITDNQNDTLKWQSFDVGVGDTVNFIQTGKEAVAINQITPTGTNASEIDGQLSSQNGNASVGEVFLINPNGAHFGSTANVDTSGLVVSTLAPSDAALSKGIANLGSTDGLPSFTGNGDFYKKNPDGSLVLDSKGQPEPIEISIDKGANINSENGHAILMFAPTISNAGSVNSTGGQVLMAAATDKVYLQEAPTSGTNSDVRGLLVEVQTGGNMVNQLSGMVSANHGNVTLMGFAVKQLGTVSATTTLNLNGSIRLIAREGANPQSFSSNADGTYTITPGQNGTTRTQDNGDGLGTQATVVLGSNSATKVTPEVEYINGVETTAVAGQVIPQSRVEIMGDTVHLQSNAHVVAPAGVVDITATQAPLQSDLSILAKDNSAIQIDSGAVIDVSGMHASRTMESNVIPVKLQSTELADAPLQKNGFLYGKTVLIDSRIGSPLANLQTEMASIPQTLAQRMTTGGSITLTSEGTISVAKNSLLNFSGGEVDFAAGYIDTTKLVNDFGQVFDIGVASPLMSYKALLAGNTAQYQPAYVQGANAGSLSITTNGLTLGGHIKGQVVDGVNQRSLAQSAQAGTLTINDELSSAATYAQNVIFYNPNTTHTVVSNADLSTALVLDSGMLIDSGVQKASISTAGTFTVADNSAMQLPAAATLTLQGSAVDIYSSIHGAGATLNLTVAGNNFGNGHVTLHSGASIDLQGAWLNDIVSQGNIANNTLAAINGGAFNVVANGNVQIQTGSSVNVSGGAWLKAANNLQNGTAGSIKLDAQARLIASAVTNNGYNISLDGTLTGYGLSQGGSLTLEANQIDVGNAKQPIADSSMRPLVLAPDFFGKGGFASYKLIADVNGLSVASNAVINLQQSNTQLTPGYQGAASANNIDAIASVQQLPAILRAPESLSLTVQHISEQNNNILSVGQGAQIIADNSSSINLTSDSSIDFNGSIINHGGNVSLHVTNPTNGFLDAGYNANQGIWLDKQANIDVSGIAMTQANAQGNIQGNVLNGGSVSLHADRGFVASKTGSNINVSGTQALLDVPVSSDTGNLLIQPQTIGSNGGAINVLASEGVFLAGGMQANAGNAVGTTGGTFAMSISRLQVSQPSGVSTPFPSNSREILVDSSNPGFFGNGFAKNGDALPAAMDGMAYVSANQLSNGGFSSLNLHSDNEIAFAGNVNIKLNDALQLDAPVYAWQADNNAKDTTVKLAAPLVTMGFVPTQSNQNTIGVPTAGNGKLNIIGDLIQVQGQSVTDGFAAVKLHANTDIQLLGIDQSNKVYYGEFDTYSQLNMQAERIYPVSMTQFVLGTNGDPNGVVTFSANDKSKPAPVLEAYGNLTVNAPTINQNGNLLAPFGNIVFNASQTMNFGANSDTSVSADGKTIPFGVTATGTTWLYPLSEQSGWNLTVTDSEKKVTVNAPVVNAAKSSIVDLSGGGDIMGYEFVPGLGGTKDVLAAGNGIGGVTSYAIVPGYVGYAPNDPMSVQSSNLTLGETLYLDAGSGLPAGEYTLLPAHYALLPGAFLITPQAARGITPENYATTRVDGADVVTGYYGVSGTSIHSQTPAQFVVESGAVAHSRSEYNISYGNTFFAQQAANNGSIPPSLAQDAGILAMNVNTYLDLPGLITSGVVKAELDISAKNNNISVVKSKTGNTGTVELLASEINKNNIGSLLLGGTRSVDSITGNSVIAVNTANITVETGANLNAGEMILAATNQVEVGATLTADKTLSTVGGNVLQIAGDSALLRVAAGQQDSILRSATTGTAGDLLIDNNANLQVGNGSLLLNATHNNTLNGEFSVGSKGALSIGANSINIGETDGQNLSGLSINNTLLNKLNLAQLELSSLNAINLYGTINPVAIGSLTLDGGGLAGFANDSKTASLTVANLTLMNSSGAANSLGSGNGQLSITASNNLNLAGGKYTISGFNSATIEANSVTTSGNGQLSLNTDTVLNTAQVSGSTGAATVIDATGHQLTIANNNNDTLSSAAAMPGAGAKLSVTADNLQLNTALIYKGGQVNLEALQTPQTAGNYALDLQSKALIDVSAVKVNAGLSTPSFIPAGEITLTADQQNIIAESGSQLLLSSNYTGVNAGTLNVNATQGLANLSASTLNASGTDKQSGGSLRMDVQSLDASGFNGLNTIAKNNFTNEFSLRQRQGDLSIDSGQTVVADTINLSADTGSVIVNGHLDASDKSGGVINLASNQGVSLGATAILQANATASGGNGGTVTIDAAKAGSADTGGSVAADTIKGINIDSQAQINVAADGGKAGHIYFRADRALINGAESVNIQDQAGNANIIGATPIVEAVEYYNLSTIAATNIQSIQADTLNYMNAALSNKDLSSQFAGSYTLMPAVEVDSAGTMKLTSNWDFSTGWRYGSTAVPGELTLRSSGNLDIGDPAKPKTVINLSDGFETFKTGSNNNDTISDWLMQGSSWAFNLVAGADMSAANMHTVAHNVNAGDVNLGFNTTGIGAKVRTGTGDIKVNAAGNINYGANAVLYTAGENLNASSNYDVTLSSIDPTNLQYAVNGGNVSVIAGGNINGYANANFVNDWLVRAYYQDNTSGSAVWGLALQTDTNRNNTIFAANYAQSIGALGGGDIQIVAGGDVKNVSAVIPTTCNTATCTAGSGLNGGGDLKVMAGGNIDGGSYYVASGQAHISADGSIQAGSAYGRNKGVDPVIALGDAQVSLFALQNIALEAVVDPMLMPQTFKVALQPVGSTPLFFGYTANSAVSVTALTGNVDLLTDAGGLHSVIDVTAPQSSIKNYAFSLYPTTFTTSALNGSISLENSFSMFPSAKGNLQLFADTTLENTSKNNVTVVLPDTDPASLPKWSTPVNDGSVNGSIGPAIQSFQIFNTSSGSNVASQHASTPLHQGDLIPAVISTGTGDIGNSGSTLTLAIAKQTHVSSGNDIVNTNFLIQQDTAASHSIIKAARDIKYTTTVDSNTQLPTSNAINLTYLTQGIQVWGPGDLTVVSGRNMDLGTADGITSVGNINNPFLPNGGANLNLLSGVGVNGPNSYNFGKDYLANNAAYTKKFLALYQSYSGDQNADLATAIKQFPQLSSSQQQIINLQLLPLVQKTYFDQLKNYAEQRASAILTKDKDSLEYQMQATVNALFPDSTLIPDKQFSYSNGAVVLPQDVDSAIKNEDVALLNKIQSQFGPTLDLGNGVQTNIPADIATINSSINSAYGKALISTIFTARPDIELAVRPSLGDIALFFSTAQTLDGGNINLLAPSGGIDAGLSVATGLAKTANQLGILAEGTGGINALVRNNFAVNLTRVMTLGGGDIVAGSTEGNIDAGRGTAGSGALAPPTVAYDANGNPIITFLPAVTTSGIRSASPIGTSVQPGNIVLFAPRGVIDAGEAGIAAKNLFLDASAFKNVANIQSTGVSVGTPAPASAAVPAGLASSSGLAASVTKSIESTTTGNSDNEEEEKKRARAAAVGILSVELLGYGE